MRVRNIAILVIILGILSVLLTVDGQQVYAAAKKDQTVSVGKVGWRDLYVNWDDSIVIEWKAVANATGYCVYRKTSEKGAKWKKVCTTSMCTVTDNKYVAEKGSKIKYRIRAYYKDKSGKKTWGKYSKIKSVTLPAVRTIELCENDIRYGWVFTFTSGFIDSDREYLYWDWDHFCVYSYDTEIIKSGWEVTGISGGYEVDYSLFRVYSGGEEDTDGGWINTLKKFDLGIDGLTAYIYTDRAEGFILKNTGIVENLEAINEKCEYYIMCSIRLNELDGEGRTGIAYSDQLKKIFKEIAKDIEPSVVRTEYVEAP